MSEWDTQLPNQWLAEGAPIIASYGMGLQGWSMAYQFASDGANFSESVDRRQSWGGSTLWNTDTPLKIGLYPALARMLYRSDITRSPAIATRTISQEELEAGTLPFVEKVESHGDVKSIAGLIPSAAMAIGRVEVRFSEHPAQPIISDLSPYITGSVVTSVTKQLAWDTAGMGCFTIDTPGTKAVVGFAPHRMFPLGAATISIDNDFAVVFVTSLDRTKDIATAKSLLITAVARQRNTGMTLVGNKLTDIGHPPIQLEGVRAHLSIDRGAMPIVTVLDMDGRRTKRTIPTTGTEISIDGAKEETIYWLLEYP